MRSSAWLVNCVLIIDTDQNLFNGLSYYYMRWTGYHNVSVSGSTSTAAAASVTVRLFTVRSAFLLFLPAASVHCLCVVVVSLARIVSVHRAGNYSYNIYWDSGTARLSFWFNGQQMPNQFGVNTAYVPALHPNPNRSFSVQCSVSLSLLDLDSSQTQTRGCRGCLFPHAHVALFCLTRSRSTVYCLLPVPIYSNRGRCSCARASSTPG